MTVRKVKIKRHTFLDFSSNKKCSKNQIKKAIQSADIIGLEQQEEDQYTIILNSIDVGMYSIRLFFSPDQSPKWRKLKDYGDFEISIYEKFDNEARRIYLEKDSRFKEQYWVDRNFPGKLRSKHLVDIILYCRKLDNLKAFL